MVKDESKLYKYGFERDYALGNINRLSIAYIFTQSG